MQVALPEYDLAAVNAATIAVSEALLAGNSCIRDRTIECYLVIMQAALIEYNLEAVDGAINAVREALASGLDWRELGQMIKAERRAGNPVAGLIDSLALDKNKITVVLENFLDEEDANDEAMTRPATKVGSQQLSCMSTCCLNVHLWSASVTSNVTQTVQRCFCTHSPTIRTGKWQLGTAACIVRKSTNSLQADNHCQLGQYGFAFSGVGV